MAIIPGEIPGPVEDEGPLSAQEPLPPTEEGIAEKVEELDERLRAAGSDEVEEADEEAEDPGTDSDEDPTDDGRDADTPA